jgi:signal transduction histidine kinase
VGRQEGEGSGELLRYVGVLGGELERLNQRIELLLRLVRPERWGEPTTLNDVVGELEELVRLEARHHEVEVHFDLQVQSARITVPRESMRQVVLNLVLAALERLPAGAVLQLRTEHDPSASRLVLEGASRSGEALGLGPVGPELPSAGLAVARALAEGSAPGAEVLANGTLVLLLRGAE